MLNKSQGMVPRTHEIGFPASTELKEFLRSPEFQQDVVEKLKSQYVVEVYLNLPQRGTPDATESPEENLLLAYTRNNAGGLRDAIDFLTSRLVAHGLDASTIRGAIPRPKSDSFEESLPFFDSKLLQRAEPPVATDSPTRSQFGEESGERSGIFDKLRKPGSISSFSSFLDRRKNGSNSPGSLFKHASSNASKASLASLESQGSGYRNPWNDSGVNLPDDDHGPASSSWSVAAQRYDSKFPFTNGAPSHPGDVTPRYDPRASVDSGRPSTSHSASGYPAPIGPPR